MRKKGRVVESTGQWYKVSIGTHVNQQTIDCRLPGRFKQKERGLTNPLAVGDLVEVDINEDFTGRIEEIKDRTNYLIRKSTDNQQSYQILAANIDHAYAVQAISKPKLKQGFLDRFLVTCEAYEIVPRIVINKIDLAGEKAEEYLQFLKELYEPLGYPIIKTSIKEKKSLQALKEDLKGHTSVFVGHSGVGKTSLLNELNPSLHRKVADVSSYNEKGKHTTTFAKLLSLDFGGYLVDTPGIREFGLVDISPWELSLFFPEMRAPRQNCKFNNCTHSHEPGCGVIEAFEKGKIQADRYDSYLNILDSLDG